MQNHPQRLPDRITISGEFIYFDYPELTKFNWRDIIAGTRSQYRYYGEIPWTVLRHSVLCALLAPEEEKPYCGSHDLVEAYVGDMTSGLKKHCSAYCAIEDAFDGELHLFLGLPDYLNHKAAVKAIDQRALVIEMTLHHHPGAQVVQKLFGGKPTKQEKALYWEVFSMSDEQCSLYLRNLFTSKDTTWELPV